MIIATDYTIKMLGNRYYVLNHEIPTCPQCGASLKTFDSKKRKITLDSGEIRNYSLRRLQCPLCDSIYLEIPDFMKPNHDSMP